MSTSGTVLVCIPTFGVGGELVEKAVRSVLAQTYSDLVCLVIGDGEEPPLPRITDSRLVTYTLPENRGAYFAEQLALHASPHPWYAQVASDDWVDPDHLEHLATYGTSVAIGAVWFHSGTKPVRVIRKLYEPGLYETDRMRAIGGFNPAERMGQDSLTLRVLRIVGPLPATERPTYHRVQRAGSLSTHPDSKKGSPAREAMRKRNREIVAECERLGDAAAIRAYRAFLVPPEIQHELNEHIHTLGGLLG